MNPQKRVLSCRVFSIEPWVVDNGVVVLVSLLHGWRWDVEGPAPDLDLLLAVLGGRLRLVQPGQATVMSKKIENQL